MVDERPRERPTKMCMSNLAVPFPLQHSACVEEGPDALGISPSTVESNFIHNHQDFSSNIFL